ncbi:MAG: flagellar biosynthesis protein FlhB [Desulfuromonadaceae bacterium]|nr:flagellar biosynthesis protein FlhB [Desulfuromonadaceae bacterium]
MADDSSGERTEQATDKRRTEFRNKGQVAQSKEIQTAAMMATTLLLWFFYAPLFWNKLAVSLAGTWKICASFEVTPNSIVNLFALVLQQGGLLLAPPFLLVIVVGFFSSVLQIGWLFTGKPLQPDFSKMNPIAGVARFVSKKSLVEIVKSMAKILLIGAVAYKVVFDEFDQALLLIDMDVVDTVRFLGRVATNVLIKSCGILILLGLFDFLFVRWEMEQKMKMTKQEQKEEFKEAEGDPYIKGRIRALQQEMSRRRMMAEVPKANVIVTNPTHLSIALLYDRQTMDAPQVVAKGADHLAMRIREIATENRIPLVENIPIARVLYKVEIGQPIPEEMFKAVAEILAYVYGLPGRK